MKAILSKTAYQKGVQCLKALYLYKHHPKLRDPLSEERRLRFEAGHHIGIKAHQLFPGGINLRPSGPSRPLADAQRTTSLIQSGTSILYEPAFIHQGVVVYNDILVFKNSGWHLYEVKSNENIPDHYIEDLALQSYIVSESGLPLHSASIVHLKMPLKDIQESTETNDIFCISDFTEECMLRRQRITENIKKMQLTLAIRRVPDITTGEHCQRPYPCEFYGYCHQEIRNDGQGLFAVPE